MELVENKKEYWEFIRNLRNHKDVKTGFIQHPDFQGKGVGKFMINKLMELNPDAAAKVKVENEASMKLFKACGFKKKYYILEKE